MDLHRGGFAPGNGWRQGRGIMGDVVMQQARQRIGPLAQAAGVGRVAGGMAGRGARFMIRLGRAGERHGAQGEARRTGEQAAAGEAGLAQETIA